MTSCKTCAQWFGITRTAVENLIHKWKLPKSALPSKDKVFVRLDEKVYTIAQQLLLTKDTGNYVVGRTQFVVDCQPLSNIICGKTPIINNEFAPMCERIFNNLHSIIRLGGTFQNKSYPIEWRPRNFNQLADALANQAMDLSMDLFWSSDVNGSWRDKDILVFSDGGFRSKHNAASAAWFIIERPLVKIDSCGIFGSAFILAKGAILRQLLLLLHG